MRVLHKSGALGGVPLRFASGIINTGAIRVRQSQCLAVIGVRIASLLPRRRMFMRKGNHRLRWQIYVCSVYSSGDPVCGESSQAFSIAGFWAAEN
jgi:hypothetical protein